MSTGKYDKNSSIELLKSKQTMLNANGINRYPQRSDFENDEVVAIKAFLGPWPRALEAAGLKSVRNDDRPQLNKEKRIRAKHNHIMELKKLKKETNEKSN